MEKIMLDPIPVGRIPSGLFIVTLAKEGRKEGFLGSWIQQASFSPLMISLALQPGGASWALMQETGRFCVNIVGHNNNGVMKPFWGAYKPGVDHFEGLATEVSARGNILLPDCLAALECELRSHTQPGDHVIVVAEVVETRFFKPEDKPMSHVRKSGEGY
jgi:flavin reductase (DIM6/NTAB) family NADH-FMN oxidoreductase RutF